MSNLLRVSDILVPRPPRPAFVAYSTKSGGKAWKHDVCHCWHHILQLATIDPVAIGLAGQTEQKERTEFRERRLKGREQTQMWTDWMWRQQRHASRDKSFQAFPLLSYCKQQKLGMEAWEQG